MWLRQKYMMTLKTYFFFLLAVLSAYSSFAQAPRKFYMRFGGNGYDVGYDVKQTLDNGYIITGSTSSFGQGNTDLYLLKLDSMGKRKFEKSFGNYNNEVGKSVLQLLDSSYVTVGYTNSTGFGGYDIFLLKTDKNGNLLWQKTIGGSDWDFAYSLQTTFDGGFVIAGTTYSYGHGNADGYVVKTDGNGDVVWTKTYGGQYDDEFKSIVQTSDGGFALTGYTKSYNDVDSGDVWVFKLDIMGDSVWCKFFGGSREDFANEIIQHPSGELYIVGGTKSYGVNRNYYSAYSFRLYNNGNFYNQTIDNTSSDDAIFNSIVVSKRTPNLVNTISYVKVSGYEKQIKVLEMDFGLNYYASAGFGSIMNDELYKLIATKDKGYAAVGYTEGDGAVLRDGYFLKLDSLLSFGSFSTVSVDEIPGQENSVLRVFPNPAKHHVTITCSKAIKSGDVRIMDCLGREIELDDISESISSHELVVQTDHLPAGVYLILAGAGKTRLVIVD